MQTVSETLNLLTEADATQHVDTRAALLRQSAQDVNLYIRDKDAEPDLQTHFCLLLDAYSAVIPSDTAAIVETCRARLASSLTAILERIVSDDDTCDYAGAIVRRATLCIGLVPDDVVGRVCQLVVKALERNAAAAPQLLVLLPACIAAAQDRATADQSALVQTAHDACRRVCETRWLQASTEAVLKALCGWKGLPAELESKVIEKAFAACSALPLNLLPGSAYQAMLLPDSSGSTRKVSLMCRAFAAQEATETAAGEAALCTFHRAQNDLLRALSAQFSREKKLFAQWLQEFGRAAVELTPLAFLVAVALVDEPWALSSALEAVRNVVQLCIREAALEGESEWLQALGTSRLSALEQLAAVLAQVARRCDGGLVPALVHVAVQLVSRGKLGAFSVKRLEWSDDVDAPGAVWAQAPGDVSVRTCLAGLSLMEQVARHHAASAQLVVQECVSRLLTAESSAAALPQLLLLHRLATQCPEVLQEHRSMLQALLEGLLTMKPGCAVSVLSILWPLCRSKAVMQRAVVARLAKAQLSRDADSRTLALQGFFVVILHQLRLGGDELVVDQDGGGYSQWCLPSQVSLSQLPALSHKGGSLLRDLEAYLRRALGQQAGVKATLYNGLLATMHGDPSSIPTVTHLLLPHLRKYIDFEPQAGEGNQFRLAMSKVVVPAVPASGQPLCMRDALPALLLCASHVASLAHRHPPDDPDADAPDQDGIELVGRLWRSVRRQLIDAAPDGLGFGFDGSYCHKSAEGLQQQMCCYSLLGALDVCVADCLLAIESDSARDSVESSVQSISVLVTSHAAVVGWLTYGAACRPKLPGGQYAKGKALPAAADEVALLPCEPGSTVSSLPVDAVLVGLQAINAEGPFEGLSQQSSLRELMDGPFLHFILTAAMSQLREVLAGHDEMRSMPALLQPAEACVQDVSMLLGSPPWLPMGSKLLQACLTVIRGSCPVTEVGRVQLSKEEADLVKTATLCLGLLVRVAVREARLLDVLGGAELLTSQQHAHAALQGRSVDEVAGADGRGEAQDAHCYLCALPSLYHALRALVTARLAPEVESMCGTLLCMLPTLPAAARACVAQWPLQLCSAGDDALLGGDAAAGLALLQLVVQGPQVGGVVAEDAVAAHLLYECVRHDVQPDQSQAELRVPEDERLSSLVQRMAVAEARAELIRWSLSRAALACGHMQWACSQVEANRAAAAGGDVPLARAQAHLRLEKALAARIALFAKLFGDCVWVYMAVYQERSEAATLLEALCKACTALLACAASLMRASIAPKGLPQPPCVPQHTLDAASAVSHHLLGAINDSKLLDHEDKNTTLAAAKHENRSVPKLIYAREEFEKAVGELAKAAKCAIAKGTKRSGSRDFQLTAQMGGAAARDENARPANQTKRTKTT